MNRSALAAALVVCSTSPAFAYIGPGAGLGAIGTAIGVLVAILLLVVGFVWYPLKRFLRKRREAREVAARTRSGS